MHASAQPRTRPCADVDVHAHDLHAGLQELYTALWEFEDKAACRQRAGGKGQAEHAVVRGSEDRCAHSQGADKGDSRTSVASEGNGAAGHGSEEGAGDHEGAGSGGGLDACVVQEGRAAEDDDRGGHEAKNVEDRDVKDLGLQLHPSWGRCHRLLEENDEFILKGEEMEVRLMCIGVLGVPLTSKETVCRLVQRRHMHTHTHAHTRACARAHTHTGVFTAASRNSNRPTELHAAHRLKDGSCVGGFTADAAAVHLLAAAEKGPASAQTLQQHLRAHRRPGPLSAKVDV